MEPSADRIATREPDQIRASAASFAAYIREHPDWDDPTDFFPAVQERPETMPADKDTIEATRADFVAASEAIHGPVDPNLVARIEEALDERPGDSDTADDEEWLAAHHAAYPDPSYVPGEITIAVTLEPELAARFPTPESVIAALRPVPKKRTLGISPDFDEAEAILEQDLSEHIESSERVEADPEPRMSDAALPQAQAETIEGLQREVERQWPVRPVVSMKTPVTITLTEPIGPAVVTQNPERMSGKPCFVGTRVPVDFLLENLSRGYPLDEIIEAYPSITREVAVEALRQATILLNLFATSVEN